MADQVQRCHTLLMPSGTYHDPDRKHLFVVCTDECEEGKHLLVSITGWTNDLCDATTRLSKGDHPFLYKDSYAFYRKARIESSAVISAGIEDGTFDEHDPMSDELVRKIMEGVCKSIHTPRMIKKYANCPEEPKAKPVIGAWGRKK